MVSDLAKGKPFAPRERVFHFVGPSGIGKSCLLKKIYWELTRKHQECAPLLVKLDTFIGLGVIDGLLVTVYESFCEHIKIKPKESKGQARKTIAGWIQKKLKECGNEQIVILLLDEVNVPSQKEMREIEEHFLVKFIHGNDRAILITAGRSRPPMFDDFALRPKPSITFRLSVFDEEKTSQQIEHLKPGAGKLAGKVVKLGSGVPGNTVKLVEHIAGDPLDIPDEAQVIRSMLDDIKKTNNIEERYYQMLEAISVLQGFFPEDVAPLFQSHPQLSDGWDEGRVKEIFLELSRIQIGPGGLVDWDREKKHWAMDESTRDLFERELLMRNSELWKKLHCTAFAKYEEWGQKYNSDLFRNKSNYHQQRLHSAELNCSDQEG
ncbi:MAG: ATP-binding protein [Bacteroidetes bacterium]|nr:ATP-binding protein [Bacteroidota bacterium]